MTLYEATYVFEYRKEGEEKSIERKVKCYFPAKDIIQAVSLAIRYKLPIKENFGLRTLPEVGTVIAQKLPDFSEELSKKELLVESKRLWTNPFL